MEYAKEIVQTNVRKKHCIGNMEAVKALWGLGMSVPLTVHFELEGVVCRCL